MNCPNCNRTMEPIELPKVPVENIKDFLNVPGNKLDDNWYWCSRCDYFDQQVTSVKLSPEMEQLDQELQVLMSNWWL